MLFFYFLKKKQLFDAKESDWKSDFINDISLSLKYLVLC